MNNMSRVSDQEKKFQTICKAYQELEKELKASGRGLVWDTQKGIFGASQCERLYELFKRIGLSQYKKFLDIGSGDGRAVLIASLFTDATGIECDEDLVEMGKKIQQKLRLKGNLLCGDFYELDIGNYDLLFINPDQGFHKGFEQKLVKEMKEDAVLLVNNNIFLPETLTKEKTIWIDQIPVIVFRKNNKL